MVKVSLMCPRACKVCPGQCVDSKKSFHVNAKKQNKKCSYIARMPPKKKEAYCSNRKVTLENNGRKKYVAKLCEATCGEIGHGRCGPYLSLTESPTPVSIPFGYGCYNP